MSASTSDLDCRQIVDGDFIVSVMAVYGTLLSPSVTGTALAPKSAFMAGLIHSEHMDCNFGN